MEGEYVISPGIIILVPLKWLMADSRLAALGTLF